MQLDVIRDDATTEVGSYFVANYPPFSVWSSEHIPAAVAALNTPWMPPNPTPLGLYLHIPFCRKRCRFCYFRVYTDKNAREVDMYMDALAREVGLYADRPGLAGRDFEFVYFGGGTPSFLSSEQLLRLIDRIRAHWSWDKAREVTFECEPGTLKKSKLETIQSIGVTRLSLGIEHFDDEILEQNGRAHRSAEVAEAYGWAREVGFAQLNVDLIAGLTGDTEVKWKKTVERTLALEPDSLTIYQLEVPYNSVLAREAKESGEAVAAADWATKRAWVDYAFCAFEQSGYVVSSAYTVVKPSAHSGFVYRDAVWRGADMVGTGVASFSHFGGIHYQNEDRWDDYIACTLNGELPVARALPVSPQQLLIREFVLQLKLGRVPLSYFARKFGVDVTAEFAEALDVLSAQGFAEVQEGEVRLTRTGLLRVDALLPLFFEPTYRNIRYT